MPCLRLNSNFAQQIISLCLSSRRLDGLTTIRLDEPDHLRDGFCGENGQQVGYEQELELFASSRGSRSELAQSDALAIIRTTAPSIDKRRVEPVHVEMLIIDEETLSYSRVTVIKSVHIEPKEMKAKISLTKKVTYSSSSASNWQSLLAMTC